MSEYKRILLIKLSSIGDVVMATPVAKALRGAFPDAYIAWVVEEKSEDMVIGNPHLDEVLVWKRGSGNGRSLKSARHFLTSLMALRRDLRAREFDVAIDLQGLLRSALVAWASGAKYRLGYDDAREGADMFYNMRMSTNPPKVMGPQQYLDILKLLGVYSDDLDMYVPISDADRVFARGLMAELGLAADDWIFALCPATTWPHKHWTEEGWAGLADVIAEKYGGMPVFLGAGSDTAMIYRICGMMRHQPGNLAGKTTLNQAAALIERSHLVVAVDTGLLHMAVSLGRHTVGLFGPTRWRQLLGKDNLAVVAKEFACMPCQRHPTCKHFDCMRAMTAEEVLAIAGPWLGERVAESKARLPRPAGVTQLQPLRTLHIETGMHSLGGPAQVVYLMTGLRNRGHEASLVCPKGSSVSRHAAAAGLEVTTVPLWTDLDATFILRLLAIIKRIKPDIVHLHSRRGADIMGGIAARMARVPAVVLSRRIDNPLRFRPLTYLKYGLLCDRVIAVSNGVASVLTKAGVDPGKITCVHSVADAQRYQKKGSEDKVRAELGISEDTNVVAIIAQLIERKGHRYLFEAAPSIIQAFPNTVFLILGEGRLEGELRNLASSLGIRDKVIFAGFRNNVGELLSVTTVLVHPATMEGFANCVLQAMAAEVPVVVTAVGGMPEAVQDGVNGILIPPRDSDAISRSVIRLLCDAELRRRMGAAGKRIVEQQFSVDSMVEGVLAVYRDVLKLDGSVGGQ